ncbi:hypothetical protein G9409_11735 [Chlorobium sp. BLA1]|nr:hypothetical protein [Candidatus Chlorobium masyuteum]NHQ61241.1 hypothetical protein [Candidatus Chlorobium masyuteum]
MKDVRYAPPPDQKVSSMLTQWTEKIHHLQGELNSMNNERLIAIKKKLSE